jgi:hypothetical protein
MTKLFKFNFANKSFDEIQSSLANYKLHSFTHRVFTRLDLFIFKIVMNKCPPLLIEKIASTKMNDNVSSHFRSNYSRPDFISILRIMENQMLLMKLILILSSINTFIRKLIFIGTVRYLRAEKEQ